MTGIRRLGIIGLAQALIVILIEVVVFKLWRYDLRVPFNYWGDTLWFSSVVKGLVQNGWVYNIPQLSAPFSLSAAAFPAMTNFDWLAMKLIAMLFADAGIVINLFWLLSIVLTGLSALAALRFLGINWWLSFTGSVLYAFLPFALMRNTAHICLTYFCVPLLCWLAIYLARGEFTKESKKYLYLGYVVCFVQGLSYIYFSFFSVLLFSTAAVIGYIKNRSLLTVKIAMIAVSIIIISTAINLAPAFYSWDKHGKPSGMGYKSPAEAETYGLKIRRMLVPHAENFFPLLRQWAVKDRAASFPIENENTTARLGIFTSFGFLLLIVSILIGKKNFRDKNLYTVASLMLFSFLVSTVGGFGAVFNTITVPDIRCYNRFSVFIAFFAIIGLCSWIDAHDKSIIKQKKKVIFTSFVISLAFFSLYDQLLDSRPLVARQAEDMRSAHHEMDMVAKMEGKLPENTMVFQLPVTGFPPDGGIEKMLTYDHARPTLWSRSLHWSWPSFSLQHQAWLNKIMKLEGKPFVDALINSGFEAVWVDRFGYKDSGDEVVRVFIASGAVDLLPAASPRYVVLDLRNAKEKLNIIKDSDELEADKTALFNDVSIEWGSGFWGAEKNEKNVEFRWSTMNNSSLVLRNNGMQLRNTNVSFNIQSLGEGVVRIVYGDTSINQRVSTTPSTVQLTVSLNSEQKIKIEFISDLPIIHVPNESRKLYFNISDFQII